MITDRPDAQTQEAAAHIAEKVRLRYPTVIAHLHNGISGSDVAVELLHPEQGKQPVVVTVFYNGSFQVEVFPLFEFSQEYPMAFDDTVEHAAAAVLDLVSTGVARSFGVKGYPPWPEPWRRDSS